MLLSVTVGKADFQEYLRTLSPIEKACYARHLQGATTQQIGRELFLDANAVRDMLIPIIVERRNCAFPPPATRCRREVDQD